ncbi:MAG: cation diffusion facilitator family transporter [Candidatus Micrarchaeota archaeon]
MAERLKAAGLSIAVNVSLLVLKAFVALRTGSIGLLAEVFHSLLDLIASVFAYFGIRKAMAPPDVTHHYGHQRFENLSSLAQVMLIILTSILVGYEAVHRIINPEPVQETWMGIAVIIISLVVAWYTSKRLGDVAVKEKSAALESDAFHFTTDVWSAVAVLVGLVLVSLGFSFGDPLAAIAVALVMLFGSFELGKKSLLVLSDAAPDKSLLEKIEWLLKKDKRITSFHKLRARGVGTNVFVDVHLRLKPQSSLEKAHFVSHLVKKEIMALDSSIEDVHIHLEPEPTSGRKRKY